MTSLARSKQRLAVAAWEGMTRYAHVNDCQERYADSLDAQRTSTALATRYLVVHQTMRARTLRCSKHNATHSRWTYSRGQGDHCLLNLTIYGSFAIPDYVTFNPSSFAHRTSPAPRVWSRSLQALLWGGAPELQRPAMSRPSNPTTRYTARSDDSSPTANTISTGISLPEHTR